MNRKVKLAIITLLLILQLSCIIIIDKDNRARENSPGSQRSHLCLRA